MKNIFLTVPDIKYQESFKNYALAYGRIDDEHYYNKYKKALEDFQGYLEVLHDYSIGKDLPDDEVRTSTFWLVDGEEVVGVVRVRHREVGSAGHIGYDISPDCRNRGYGSQILRLALEKAANIGIAEAIVTCNVDNTASRKII